MRVNSTYKGLFNSRSAAGSGITIVMLIVFFVTSSFTIPPDRDLWAKQVNIMIRQMGHRLLLQAGDSTSRVLPVAEIREGTFQLKFENEFFFNDDSLIVLSQSLLPKIQFPAGYTVTIHESAKADIVYGFQINNTSGDILPCRGRSQPPGRYRIEIAFPDLYERTVPKEHVKNSTDIDQPAEKPRSIRADLQEVNSTTKELKTTIWESESLIKPRPSQSYPFVNLVFCGALLLLGVALLIGPLDKYFKSVPVKNEHPSILKEPAAKLAALGEFLFDVKNRRLILEREVIDLTDKECRVLELLNENFGELIRRETLMQKIWISEGVITGRSLDMFVSKLRKKLSRDPELRITNIHGKGYKLEMSGIQAS